jgi:phage gp46-like protein
MTTLPSSPLNGPKEWMIQTKGSLKEVGRTANTYASEAMASVTSGI